MWAPLIRLPLLPKQFYKLQTFSLCKFVGVLQSFTQGLFKWYLHWQDQARSQEFVMGGGSCCRRSGAEPPAAGGWVSEGGSGGETPSARRFLRFFNKNNVFLGIFRLKFLL